MRHLRGLALGATVGWANWATVSWATVGWATVGWPQLAAADPPRVSPALVAQRNPPGSTRIVPPIPLPDLPDQLPLPAPADLLPPPALPTAPAGEVPAAVFVEQIEVVGSTVFSAAELAAVTQPYVNRSISFVELLQARSAITQLYVSQGYITSGAFVPPQTIENGRVVIQVIEGSLESIEILGTRHLSSSYLRRRLALSATAPLNQTRLLEGLQLLQLDPLIQSISADLQSGTRPGSSVLQVTVQEADSFNVTLGLNNGRSPSVGSFRRQIQFEQANLTGLGDALSVEYLNTNGSNEVNGSYEIPLNPRNGRLRLALGRANSRVIQPPFDQADIAVPSRYYELSYRQPMIQSPTQELALGLTASRQESQTLVGGEGFPLALEADASGRTRVSALRLTQDWTDRSSQHVLALRSQLSLGLDWLDATVNEDLPDSRFLAWRGQGQWVRQLAPDLLLLLRGDMQLSDGELVSLEQFGLGGAQSVRGYRQDALLSNDGALFSTEARMPLLRVPEVGGLLQIVPFLDVGTTWHNSEPLDPGTLVGVGLGLLWQQPDLSARLDWGIPLVPLAGEKRSLQENGIYFSLIYSPF
ncbi:MAG: ShlB/FhaC/HecB family hemolysin secretion/activation protein [Pegethrix bostrychoides GSE-TBD4-15B]|uniref:ShlB/FhaC/HecB family hemolysin secretion/activation protein n=1 Tax=Pegethrix bostrychoides GSE-TBD4-15B TaxID=2839662 RepID=A0A951P9M1_9CYAN|nr:ShlB/FhaC/HecB family hemolysin secretion/activation protein [Pegethrix bostrychoides GSE-TBD4-15B]